MSYILLDFDWFSDSEKKVKYALKLIYLYLHVFLILK